MEENALADDFAKLMREIAEEHGLSTISLNIPTGDRSFCAYAHWGDKQCEQGFGRTIGQAVRDAIRAKQDRELPFAEAA